MGNKENIDIVSETQVVVLMGGLGTRLGLEGRPKAMADIEGIPFFDYQLKLLKRWKFHKFLFLVGYQANYIEKYYGDGSRWDVDIKYSYDGSEQLGTGGALKNAENKLEEEFLLIYGDSFMDIDYQETVYRYYIAKRAGKAGVMTILQNRNRYDKSNVVYENRELVLYDKTNTSKRMQYIDYGVSMMSKNIFSNIEENKKFDLAELLTVLSREGKLAAQVVTKRFYEIGTPTSMQEFSNYVKGRFHEKKGAVFMDRDGVVNELVYNDDTEQLDSPFVWDEFVYRQGVIDELLFVQKRGYYIFIVTNQPGAAKGKIPLDRLYDLNTWMVQDLKSKGIEIEFVSICPHHPVGSQGTEDSFLIRKCGCRKPEAGMLTDLLQVYNIDLEKAYMVGDSYTDVLAGKRAGLKTILVGGLKCDTCQRLQGNRPDHIIDEITKLGQLIAEKGKDYLHMYQQYIENYLEETKRIADQVSVEQIDKSAEILRELKIQEGRLFILGAGGSAANASHAVNDFRKIGGIETYAPTDNVAELSARTNDEGWETTFVEWLRTSRLSNRDVVMVFSVGGGSERASLNIVQALKLAKERGAKILSIVSRDGGYSKEVSDACILIPVLSNERITPHAEGWQGIIWHLLVNAIA